MERPLPVIARGAVAGLIGGAILALWFFIVDLVRGEPFGTVTFLSGILTGTETRDPAVGPIALYSLFHFGVFTVLGIALASIFDRSPIIPNVLMGIAVGLLLFASVFYSALVISGEEVIAALGWPQILVGNLLASIGLMESLRLLGPAREKGWWEALGESATLNDGVVAGIIGATAVAIWFFVPDLISREPFFTPAAMGSALLHGATDQAAVEITPGIVAFYTLIHYGVFLVIGLIASALLSKAEESPRVIFFGMLFFIAYGAFFFGIIALFGEWILGALAWWNIALGTLIGVAIMGGYLIHAHPTLRQKLRAQESATAPPKLPQNPSGVNSESR